MTMDKNVFLHEKGLLTGNLNLELKKNIMCLVQSIALYDTEIGIQAGRLEAVETCIWGRMDKIS